MGNNPVIGVDPDGRFSKFGAWWRNGFSMNGVYESGGEWGYSRNFSYTDVSEFGALEGVGHNFVYKDGLSGNIVANAWNSPLARAYVPDIIYVGGGFTGVAGFGGGTSVEVNWIIRGPDASLFPVFTTTQTLGAGMAIDGTINLGGFNYIGSVNSIRKTLLQTSSPNGDFPAIWSAVGVEAGLVVGVHGSYTRTAARESIIGRGVNIGIGFPSVGRGASGVSNTWILNK